MTRLAINGAEADRRALDGRLAGATLTPNQSQGDAPLDCDAVLWLSSTAADGDLIRRALAAGKHVLLTGPSWLSGTDLDDLTTAAQQGGARLAVENPDRHLPSRRAIRQQLDGGRLGAPGLIRAHRWLSAAAASSDLLPGQAGGEGGPTPPAALVQDIDAALWLMGKAPELVYAVQGDGALQVHLGFLGGGMAMLDYADCLPEGDGYSSLSVIGSTGAAYADDHQNVQLLYRGGSPAAVHVGERAAQLAALAQTFITALRDGQDLSAGLAGWRLATSVAATALRSAAVRRALTLEAR